MGTGSPKGAAGTGIPAAPLQRKSTAFDQFWAALQQRQDPQSVLDMSGASQANISFITGQGHRISSDDIVGTMEECFGKDFLAGQQAAANVQRFLDQSLTFADAAFDGALVWDVLQFVSEPLLDQLIGQLLRVMRPGGLILLYFNADAKASRLPVYNYRIQDQKTLLQVPRPGTMQTAQFFPNRSIEKMFDKATSLKFFLTRDSVREVLVRR